MEFIVFTGLPGTGKSCIAEAVGRELSIAVFAKDRLEAALRRSGLDPEAFNLGYTGYELLTTLASRQLALDQSVILDSVASTDTIREEWRTIATENNASWRVVECICSDESVHRARLATRQRNIPGWHELSWADVQRVKSYYKPWQEARLILDAVNPFNENFQATLAYLSCGERPQTITIESAGQQDLPAIATLLEQNDLPPDGLIDHLEMTFVARENHQVVGCAALEVYENAALLRSVVTSERVRGQGLGQRLIQTALSLAQQQGIAEIYLLTTTVKAFFHRFGFQPIDRAHVASAVQNSVEFTITCCESAVAMVLRLNDKPGIT